jgi:ABC-type sulfate transport system permease subunit
VFALLFIVRITYYYIQGFCFHSFFLLNNIIPFTIGSMVFGLDCILLFALTPSLGPTCQVAGETILAV